MTSKIEILKALDLTGLLRLSAETIGKFKYILDVAKEKSWNEIVICLEMLEELTQQHIEAINKVVSPILENNDIQSTAQRYYELVNNHDFPSGYDYAHGFLTGAQERFHKDPIYGDLKRVKDRLYNFQYAAFLLNNAGFYDTGKLSGRLPGSYRIAGAMNTANTLCNNITKSDTEIIHLRGQVQEEFLQAFKMLGFIYLFSWSKVPGDHNRRLLNFLKDDFDIDIKDAKIQPKTDDKKILINIKKKPIEIILENDQRAILKINDQTYNLHTIKEKYLNVYKSYMDTQISPDMFQLNTSEDVLRLVAKWCRYWQIHVQWILYGDHGLNYAIGQLKAHR